MAINATLPAGLNNIQIQKFSENIHMLVEQKASVLASIFPKEIIRGKAEAIPRMGVVNMSPRVQGSYTQVPFTEIGTDFRYMTLQTFDLAVPVAKIDIDRIGLDPSGLIAQRVMSSIGRAVDNVVINALLGSAATGANGGGTAATIGSSQLVAVNDHSYDDLSYTLTGNMSFTVSKLMKQRQIILAAKRPLGLPDGGLICLLSANQWMHLQQDPRFVNMFFADEKVLATGGMGRYMDVSFHLYEEIPLNASGREQVLLFDSHAARVGMAPEGIKVQVDYRPDVIGFVNQIKAELDIGAVRMEENLITVSDNVI